MDLANGTATCVLTDTDDSIIELEAGKAVRIVDLDSTQDGIDTLLPPLAVVKKAPHRKETGGFIDCLLSAKVEGDLQPGLPVRLH